MATKNGSSYTTGSETDSVEIPTASPGFQTMTSSNKVWPSDCDNDRQPEMAIQSFCSPIVQFLVVDRCRNHLANHPLSWPSSKIRIWRWNFDVICHSSTDVIISSFGCHIDISGCRSHRRCCRPTYLPILFLPMRGVIRQICRWNFNCTFHSFRDISISGFGRRFRLSVIIVSLPAIVECRRFVVGMLMVYVIVSESDISVLPVSWLPSLIFDTMQRRP